MNKITVGITLGIDLGTTNSVVTCLDEAGQPRIIKNSEGDFTTPSVICMLPSGEMIVGKEAKNLAAAYPECVVREIKRQMGKVDGDGKPIAFFVDHNGKEWTPEELSALIIKKLLNDARLYTGHEVGDIVITCPNYFRDDARTATINAGKIAGAHVLDCMDEPTAAATFYGLNHNGADMRRYMIYDLGGGTFDVTIVEVSNGEVKAIATDGARDLGGTDWDLRVMARIASECQAKGITLDPDIDAAMCQEAKDRAERLKESLSTRSEAVFNMRAGSEQISFTYTRDEFESDSADLLEQTAEKVRSALNSVNMNPADIEDTVLVGGATRMPMVRELINKIMGKDARQDTDVDLVVAQGASISAAHMAKQDGRKVYSIIGSEILSLPGGSFTNVAAHALGCAAIDPDNGLEGFTPIIKKNTALPASCSETFALTDERQTTADVKVYQGQEGESLEDCLHIDTVTLSGLPCGPTNEPRIEVKYEYSRSGIVHVTVTDLKSGKSQVGEISHQMGLSDEEIDSAAKNIKENS